MAIICDLEQGGKIDEDEAFEQIKSLYKQFKFYYKHFIRNKGISRNLNAIYYKLDTQLY